MYSCDWQIMKTVHLAQ